jgi:putative membrane protein
MGQTKSSCSIAKGFLAGVVGGLAGAGVKMLAEEFFPPRIQGQTPPGVILAEQIAGHDLPQTQQKVALHTIHWVFGALAGGVYGALVEMEPSFAAWRGAAFGITLNRITHEALLPKMGLAAPTGQQPTQERLSEWVTHAAYGVGTDSVRRFVRRGL